MSEPVNSIIHQGFCGSDQDDPMNGDGFGIAWYVAERQLGRRTAQLDRRIADHGTATVAPLQP